MAKKPAPPKSPKSKAPNSKAHRPDVQPIGPALEELLNPAINRGESGLGSSTGLKPPPDNSWDRRAGGEAAARRPRGRRPKARAMMSRKGMRAYHPPAKPPSPLPLAGSGASKARSRGRGW